MKRQKKIIIGVLVVAALIYVMVVIPWLVATVDDDDGSSSGGGGAEASSSSFHRNNRHAALVEPHDLLPSGAIEKKKQPVSSSDNNNNNFGDEVKKRVFTVAPSSFPNDDAVEIPPPQQRKNDHNRNVQEKPATSEPIASVIHHQRSKSCDSMTGYHDDEGTSVLGGASAAARGRASSDFKVKDSPGGTEEEALLQRRRLLVGNRPDVPANKMRWRPAERKSLPVSLTSCMAPSQPKEELTSMLARAVHHCLPPGITSGENSPANNGNAYLLKKWKIASLKCIVEFYSRNLPLEGRGSNSVPQTSTCSNTYGEGLLAQFANSAPWKRCEAKAAVGSSVSCRSVTAHFSHSDPTSVCWASNVVVDYSQMLDGDYPWLAFQSGALQSFNCRESYTPPSGRPADGMFMHCLADWMKLGYRFDPNPSQGTHLCTTPATTDNTPTLFLTRSGDFSPFAVVHDVINALIVYAVQEVDLRKVQVVVMDRMGMGFYSPLIQLILSPSKPVQWLPDLRQKRMCYTQAYFNIPARLSPIYNQDSCGGVAPLYAVLSDIIQLTSNYRLGREGRKDGEEKEDVDDEKSGSFATPISDVITITIITRKNYATGHSIGRRIQNHKELVSTIRSRVTPEKLMVGKRTPPPRSVVVRNIDFALWDFDQQVGISATTDVLVAMHGAGLVQALFLPRKNGAVFEVFCPEKPSSNYRYQQLSAKLGIQYDSMEIVDPSNVIDVNAAIRQITTLATKSWSLKATSV